MPQSALELYQRTELLGSNSTSVTTNFPASVGKGIRLKYIVGVKNSITGQVLCEKDLQPTIITPSEQAFMRTSDYRVSDGLLIPALLVPANPMYFIPWYIPASGGPVNIHMQGHGCDEYHGDLWDFNDVLTISGAKSRGSTGQKENSMSCSDGCSWGRQNPRFELVRQWLGVWLSNNL